MIGLRLQQVPPVATEKIVHFLLHELLNITEGLELCERPGAIVKFVRSYGDIATLDDVLHGKEKDASLANWRFEIEQMQSMIEDTSPLARPGKRQKGDRDDAKSGVVRSSTWPRCGLTCS